MQDRCRSSGGSGISNSSRSALLSEVMADPWACAVSSCRVDGRLRNPQRYSDRMRVGSSIRIIRNEGEATHGPSCVGAMAQKFLPPLAASSRSLSVSRWRAALELTVVVGRTVGRMFPSSSKSYT